MKQGRPGFGGSLTDEARHYFSFRGLRGWVVEGLEVLRLVFCLSFLQKFADLDEDPRD